MKRLTFTTLAALAAVLTIGVATAAAHGGPGRGEGSRGVKTGALVTQAAKQLEIPRAKLKQAIVDSANASIDDAVADEDLDEAEGADLKDEVNDNLRAAYAFSRTRTVASNLGITTAKLNSASRSARKALILAKIDQAVGDGDLTEEEAAQQKADLEGATLPGYKAGGRGFGAGGCGPGR